MNSIDLISNSTKVFKYSGIRGIILQGTKFLHRKTTLLEHQVHFRRKRQKLIGYSNLSDPWKPIYVAPSEIDWYRAAPGWGNSSYGFSRDLDIGRIVPGNWDRDESTIAISENQKFSSVLDHFENGTDWADTKIYSYMERMIEKRGVADGCHSLSDVRERYERIDELYNKIAKEGYRSQKSLDVKGDRHPTFREVCISIGHDGRIIFGGGGGTHRLAIAISLGIDEIPVGVIVRHKEWQLTKENVESIRDKNMLNHPDIRAMKNFD